MARKKEKKETVENSLAEAVGIGGGAGLGFPSYSGIPGTAQVENTGTMFKNLRYYLVSNMRQLLNQCYAEIGLVQTICDVPVDDALRGGIVIKSDQLDESQIAELQVALDRDDDLNIAGQAAKWNRLFGGAGILLIVDNQDPELPLDIDDIDESTEIEFRAVDMWELYWDCQGADGFDPAAVSDDFEFYNYYGEKVHKTRVLRMTGITAPSFIRPRLRGWGLSVVEILVRSINQYLKATDLAFEVLDEFKVDVYKIKNLTASLFSPQGLEAIQRRIQIANYQKNYQNAVIMDTEDDWDHKQLSFTGIGEAMLQIRMQVAADMRMPMTKLFGISASGFNSGEDDIEVYNGMVESQVRNKIKFVILKMLEIKSQKIFGFVPDDLSISFQPLRVMSSEQEETVKDKKFSRLHQSLSLGALSIEEFRDACNKSQLFDITLEKDAQLEADYEDMAMAARGMGEDEETDGGGDDGNSKSKAQGKKASDGRDSKADTGNSKKASEGKEKKTKNAVVLPPPYTTLEKAARAVTNSAIYDLKAYETYGGDSWIDPRRKAFFERPDNVDKALWEKARAASKASLGEERWQFTTWWYRKHGGKFSYLEH